MPAVHLDHLSFSFTSAVDLLLDADLHIGSGWTGVVGANGSGKTTLLHLIAGRLAPTAGRLVIDPADAIVALCEQEVGDASESVRRLAESWDAADHAMRSRLRLDPVQIARWESLSPGERKRWQIGAALASRPDVLLLDEPTNHVDDEARAQLVYSIERFAGVGIIVSHDRRLLDSLTTRTLRLAHGAVTLRSGGYTVARAGWRADEEAALADYRQLRREQKKVDRRIADKRRATQAKRASFARQMRTSSIKDLDARSAAATGVFRAGEQAAAKSLASSVRTRERIAGELSATTITRELGGSVFVDYEPAPKRSLARRTGPLVVDDHVVLPSADVAIERTSRVWVRGPNGAGKTTLIEDLLDQAGLPDDRVLYLPQDLDEAATGELLARVRAMPASARGSVLAIVALLGVDPETLLASDRPSPGEARKLAMALGLGERAWLLVLDEPTNHLDVPSIERLEAALRAYPGALLVVTHDEAFGEALDLTEWRIEERRLVRR